MIKFIFNNVVIIVALFFLCLGHLNAQTSKSIPGLTSPSEALVFTKHIPGKPNDMNDWLSDITGDSTGGIYILTGHTSELLHYTLGGDLKEEVKIENNDQDIFCWSRMVIDRAGNFYLITRKGFIEKYNKSLNFIAQYPRSSATPTDGSTGLPANLSIKMDIDGHICVLKNDFEFVRLDEDLNAVGTVVLKPKINWIYPSKFNPSDFTFDSSGKIVVTFHEGIVMEFDPTGLCVKESCNCGSKKGELDDPGAICGDRDNNFYICDTRNHRIVKLNSSLLFQTQWEVEDQFNGGPGHVTVDSEGNIWVLARNDIFKFNGTLISQEQTQVMQSNDVAKQVSQCFSIDEYDKISKSFWNYSPRIRTNTAEMAILHTKENLPLLAGQILDCFKGRSISDIYIQIKTGVNSNESDNDDATAQEIQKSNTGKSLIKKLLSLGFKAPDEFNGGPQPIEFLKKTNEGYLWGYLGNLYFVPKKDPTEAIFVYKNTWMMVDEEDIEKLSEGYWRVYIQYQGQVGRMASERYVDIYDLDMKNKKITSVSGREALDLDSDGKKELIVVEDVNALGRIEWPWIFSWDGKTWIDVSKNYPNYYKNEKYTGEWGDWGAGDNETYQKVFGVIQKAAEMGGPSAFVK